MFRDYSKATQIFCAGFFLFLFSSCQTSPKKDPDFEEMIETKILLAQSKLEQAKPHAVLPELRALDLKYPNTPMVLNMLGLVHLALNNYKKALENTKKAYLLEPKKIAFGLNLSSIYLSLGKTEVARKLLAELAKDETYPYRERIFHNTALSYEKENRLEEAQRYYEAALVENPVYYLSMVGLAKLYEKRSLSKKAFQAYKKASDFCPTCYEPRVKLAEIYAPSKIAEALRVLDAFIGIQEVTEVDRRKAKKLRDELEKKYSLPEGFSSEKVQL